MWTVGERNGEVKPSKVVKVPYTTKYRIKDDVSADQRKTMERWNEMVDALKELGAMDDKK